MTAAVKPAAPAQTHVIAILRIALEDLHESPWNPRAQYDPQGLEELAASLLQTGQLTPIIVRPRKPGGYEIAAGHRRFRAAQLARRKHPEGAAYRGLGALEAKVVQLDDAAFVEVLNIENLQRDDLHPLEEATGFRDLMERAGYDVAKIAARIGRSDRYVYDSLTLLRLIPEAKKLFLTEAFERGHAIELARLTPEQQKRALDVTKNGAELGEDSLLLEHDSAAEDELPLHDRVKPVSVREFKHAIQRQIRATPDRVDPFLFPESAKALEEAKEEKLGVIHITREYLATDEVRQSDQKARVFGSQAWKRADGGIEENERTGRRVKSQPCDWSRYGFVASGPGQGEVFRVCINKDKCKVHWPEQVKRAEERKRQAKKAGSPGRGKAKPGKPAQDTVAEERRRAEAEEERADLVHKEVEQIIKARGPQWAQQVCALANQIKLPKQIALYLVSDHRLLGGGLEDICDGYDDDATQRGNTIFAAMKKSLPGKWRTAYAGTPEPQDEKAAIVGLALLFWLANCTKTLDAEVEQQAEKVVAAAELAAAAKAPKAEKAQKAAAKKPAKKKGGRK